MPHNPGNERIKRRYLSHLKETRGFGGAALDQIAKAFNRYEIYTKFRDFGAFHREQVKGFKNHLAQQKSLRTNETLSQATIYSTLQGLKAFFLWLSGQPGFRSKFSQGDWEYFNPSGVTTAIAKAHRPKRAPTLEQVRQVLRSMPSATEFELRDRAVVAFIALTGARAQAVTSFQLQHIDVDQRLVLQDARAVKTKFRKTFETWFFPVGEDIEQIVIDWVHYLKKQKLWGLDDPLFPATQVGPNLSHHFAATGLARKPWSDTGPIREIFKRAFGAADLPYSNPHSLRNTLTAFGNQVCKTWAERQAWAQNLGHESLTTTFGSYGKVAPHDQAKLVRNAGKTPIPHERYEELAELVVAKLRGDGLGRAG